MKLWGFMVIVTMFSVLIYHCYDDLVYYPPAIISIGQIRAVVETERGYYVLCENGSVTVNVNIYFMPGEIGYLYVPHPKSKIKTRGFMCGYYLTRIL